MLRKILGQARLHRADNVSYGACIVEAWNADDNIGGPDLRQRTPNVCIQTHPSHKVRAGKSTWHAIDVVQQGDAIPIEPGYDGCR